jgi:ribosomal protein S18 acetylase RimI-like enzyme
MRSNSSDMLDAMRIRDLSSVDVSAAVALWDDAGLARPWNPPALDLQRALDGPTSTVLGAFNDELLVGTVMFGHDGHRGWIYYLAVEETHRSTGLGRQLMAAAETWLREHGAVKVQLMVRAENTAVRAFYDHLGYEDSTVLVRSKWLNQ